MRRIVVLLVVAVLAAGCSADDDTAADDTPTTSASTTTPTGGTDDEGAVDQEPPPSINGITVDGGSIWVASIAGDEVLEVDRETGELLARFPTDGAGPDDVAVGPDGAVWVTGFLNGDIGRITDGTYEVVTTIASGVNPVDVGADGVVFIGTFGPEGTLYQLSPIDGGAPGEMTEPATVAEGLPDINAFSVSGDGTLLAPGGGLTGPGSVVEIDPRQGTWTEVVGGLPPVLAGAATPDGGFVALANTTGEVFAVDVDAGTAELVHTATGGPFDNLAYGDDGVLYLSSFVEPRIVEVAADGTERVIELGS